MTSVTSGIIDILLGLAVLVVSHLGAAQHFVVHLTGPSISPPEGI